MDMQDLRRGFTWQLQVEGRALVSLKAACGFEEEVADL